jgi:hypothetical protein
MAIKSQSKELPAFDRAVIFAEVDASNQRFENYTAAQRRELAAAAKAQRVGMHEARRVRH